MASSPNAVPPGVRTATLAVATLLEFRRRFYEVILLDLGTGVTAPIATFADDHADQVVVTTPEWLTNTMSRWRSATCGWSA